MIQSEHCEEYSCEARGMLQKGEQKDGGSKEPECVARASPMFALELPPACDSRRPICRRYFVHAA